jgi:hypothetical protein
MAVMNTRNAPINRIVFTCACKQTKGSQSQCLVNAWTLSQVCSIVLLHKVARPSTPGHSTTLK